MSIPTFDPKLTSSPKGTPKDFYTLYNGTLINNDPTLSMTQTTIGQLASGPSVYNTPVGQDVAVAATYGYQEDLKRKVADRASMNQDINDHLNYTMMAMAIWVPLGVFAGYYLFNRGTTTA